MKIKSILLSQPKPADITKTPYDAIIKKYNVNIDFEKFIKLEDVTASELRQEKVKLTDFTAIILTSRNTIDHFFRIAKEMRYTIPEDMKYFCVSETTALYLQNYIQYRKRKIFYGSGTPESIIELVSAKHKAEKFLITASVGSNTEPVTRLFENAGLDYKVGTLVKAVSQDLHELDLNSYDMMVMFNPFDIVSLKENFPDFQQGDIKLVSFGKTVVKAIEDAGMTITVKAPTPEAPSVGKAIELYLQNNG